MCSKADLVASCLQNNMYKSFLPKRICRNQSRRRNPNPICPELKGLTYRALFDFLARLTLDPFSLFICRRIRVVWPLLANFAADDAEDVSNVVILRDQRSHTASGNVLT